MNTSQKVKINKEILQVIPDFNSVKPHWSAMRPFISNAHDADADRLKITFVNFDENYRVKEEAKIIIEDNGSGIKKEMLKNWFVPGYSTKVKKSFPKRVTEKGRRQRGGDGMARFGFLNLGKKVKITTRTNGDKNEYVLKYDFSEFKNGSVKSLDDVKISLAERKPQVISKHGSIIEISALHRDWSPLSVEIFHTKLIRRQFSLKRRGVKKFDFYICKDDKCTHHISYNNKGQLRILLSVIRSHIFAEVTKAQIYLKQLFSHGNR